ncbi:MAG: EamA/RhaT family transporter [Flavobacteriaceae bacterium]|nr:EamA/RhaT family transporter [Bacteroidia bacterium]NNL15750.1 EamA/RhaT family transporter [Flavobacteriaceae bacterium]
MIYLLLSIAASTIILILFKLFERYRVNTLQAIVVNYITACSFGLISYNAPINVEDIVSSKWFFGAFALGFLFIAIFNVMALTAQRNGLSVASVAAKMSVIIPVIFGIYMYKESVGFQKVLGIILALVAVYLTSIKSKSSINTSKGLLLPVILFLGSGIIDTSIKYLETTYVAQNGIPIFSATIFCFAGIIGIGILIKRLIVSPIKLEFKNLYGGVALGIVNYYSIYFLLKALQYEGTESSTIFTVNNVAIVMLSTLIGLVLFRETIYAKNWIGIAIAVVSITLVTLA